MLFAKSRLNSFKVQNGLQAQSENVKVFNRKYERHEKMPVNTVNQSVSHYNKKFKNTVISQVVLSFHLVIVTARRLYLKNVFIKRTRIESFVFFDPSSFRVRELEPCE